MAILENMNKEEVDNPPELDLEKIDVEEVKNPPVPDRPAPSPTPQPLPVEWARVAKGKRCVQLWNHCVDPMCRKKGVFSHTTKPVCVLKDEYI